MRAIALALGIVLGGAPAPPARTETELVVFAAASLREALQALGEAFERDHPGVRVALDFAGSQELAAQIVNGAVVDVFASADREHVDALEHEGLVRRGHALAGNEPVIVVPRRAAVPIAGLEDLPNAPRIVVGAPEVPIGRYTRQILERAERRYGAGFRARVERQVVSTELNVRQVLAKVSLGEADAAIVYRTDAAAAAEQVRVVAIPADLNVRAEYWIAEITAAPHAELARAFVEKATGEAGCAVFRRFGFSCAGRVAP